MAAGSRDLAEEQKVAADWQSGSLLWRFEGAGCRNSRLLRLQCLGRYEEDEENEEEEEDEEDGEDEEDKEDKEDKDDEEDEEEMRKIKKIWGRWRKWGRRGGGGGGGRGGPPFLVNIHVMSLGNPGTLAKARKFQLVNASFRDFQ